MSASFFTGNEEIEVQILSLIEDFERFYAGEIFKVKIGARETGNFPFNELVYLRLNLTYDLT